MVMSDTQPAEAVEFTVDELAQRARLPVRTIREYQTLRLLPAPRRQGRTGVYGQAHLDRLAALGRLPRPRHSLPANKDLPGAGAAGGLPAPPRANLGAAALDEPRLPLPKA